MKCPISVGVAVAVALLPLIANAAPAKSTRHRSHAATARPAPVYSPVDAERGNAALGGNNANSASGSNSAGENANGRTGGGFGG